MRGQWHMCSAREVVRYGGKPKQSNDNSIQYNTAIDQSSAMGINLWVDEVDVNEHMQTTSQ